MQIQYDKQNQPYIQWEQAPGGYKRAWIQRKQGERDWAGSGRYLNVVRTEGPDTGPAGNATEFPIFSNLPDEQILQAFVAAICAVTGYPLPAVEARVASSDPEKLPAGSRLVRSVLTAINCKHTGRAAEDLAASALETAGFHGICNLNQIRSNFVFADILAEKDGTWYAIAVKGRNRITESGEVNNRYKLDMTKAPTAVAELRAMGIQAVPAFVAVEFDGDTHTAYFGELNDTLRKNGIGKHTGPSASRPLVRNGKRNPARLRRRQLGAERVQCGHRITGGAQLRTQALKAKRQSLGIRIGVECQHLRERRVIFHRHGPTSVFEHQRNGDPLARFRQRLVKQHPVLPDPARQFIAHKLALSRFTPPSM